MTIRFAKTEPGRYYAKGESHTYLSAKPKTEVDVAKLSNEDGV